MCFGRRKSRVFVLAGLALGLATATAPAEPVRVVDGDTIEIGGVVHRIHGIDAPEAGQTCARAGGGRWPCGRMAIEALTRIVGTGPVRCAGQGTDSYGRTLSLCHIGGTDVGGMMVDLGLAWSFRKYAHDYDAAEDAAHRSRRGVWQAETEAPWDYRARRWAESLDSGPPGCPIKGNINRDGTRIYHAPWSPWWAKTSIDTRTGERWFCSEGEALAAGWRAPFWAH
jgi:endonuclease YncB( thermonuclease family)